MSAGLETMALHLADLERRLQVMEDNCAGCPGSMTPQDFALDVFPVSHQHQAGDFDDFEGVPR